MVTSPVSNNPRGHISSASTAIQAAIDRMKEPRDKVVEDVATGGAFTEIAGGDGVRSRASSESWKIRSPA